MRILLPVLLPVFLWTHTMASPGPGAHGLVNVALNKPTRQISTHGSAVSSLAVDGNKNPAYEDGSCSHTGPTGKKWWVVDLMTSFPIHSVRITNRDHYRHIRDFYIYISVMNPVGALMNNVTDARSILCSFFPGLFPSEQTLHCRNVTKGRYVYLWQPNYPDAMCMCEVEVFATQDSQGRSGHFRDFYFKMTPQMKIMLTPFSSNTLEGPPNFLKCVFCCLATEGWFLKVVQFNKNLGLCECIEVSSLDESSLNKKEAEGWVLLEDITN